MICEQIIEYLVAYILGVLSLLLFQYMRLYIDANNKLMGMSETLNEELRDKYDDL